MRYSYAGRSEQGSHSLPKAIVGNTNKLIISNRSSGQQVGNNNIVRHQEINYVKLRKYIRLSVLSSD